VLARFRADPAVEAGLGEIAAEPTEADDPDFVAALELLGIELV
jgi:hypothetical protein